MATDSFRNCEIVQQVRFLPGYPDWQPELEKRLADHADYFPKWAYILHDKDQKKDDDGNLIVDENGNPELKEPHIHLVLCLSESLRASTIGGYFGVDKQYVESIKQKIFRRGRSCADVGGALSYLTHRNKKESYQYDDSEVVAAPGYDWKAVREKSEQAREALRQLKKVYADIESGEVRRFNIFERVTMQQYIDHKAELERAFDYREGLLKQNANRDIDVIYIYGSPGTGKTTLAKEYCQKCNFSCCISGSSRDPLQEYGGQDVLVLDDIRADAFPLSDLLKILDNHTGSAASARYHDKFLEVKAIILTSVLTIGDFFDTLVEVAQTKHVTVDEPVEQLFRRCRIMIWLTEKEKKIYIYNDKIHDYVPVGTGPNDVFGRYKSAGVESEDDLKNLCTAFGVEYSPKRMTSGKKSKKGARREKHHT